VLCVVCGGDDEEYVPRCGVWAREKLNAPMDGRMSSTAMKRTFCLDAAAKTTPRSAGNNITGPLYLGCVLYVLYE
jgi:hypothetical protein